ncbi:hypothetical protein CLF_107509, partial [Clonorchis sinensis]
QLNVLHQAASRSSCNDILDIAIRVYSNALLIRLLKILRQPTTGFQIVTHTSQFDAYNIYFQAKRGGKLQSVGSTIFCNRFYFEFKVRIDYAMTVMKQHIRYNAIEVQQKLPGKFFSVKSKISLLEKNAALALTCCRNVLVHGIEHPDVLDPGCHKQDNKGAKNGKSTHRDYPFQSSRRYRLRHILSSARFSSVILTWRLLYRYAELTYSLPPEYRLLCRTTRKDKHNHPTRRQDHCYLAFDAAFTRRRLFRKKAVVWILVRMLYIQKSKQTLDSEPKNKDNRMPLCRDSGIEVYYGKTFDRKMPRFANCWSTIASTAVLLYLFHQSCRRLYVEILDTPIAEIRGERCQDINVLS